MTETLEQSVKRTAEYPFLLLYEMRYSEAFGELAHLFFESMMDDDDGRGERNVHQIPPPIHEQLQMPIRKRKPCVFFVIFLFGLKD